MTQYVSMNVIYDEDIYFAINIIYLLGFNIHI